MKRVVPRPLERDLDEEFQRIADKRWAKVLASGETVPVKRRLTRYTTPC